VAYIDLGNAEGISDRTRTILTYALCGFSNFGAIGIQLGGIGPLAPERKGDLAQLGLRAMLGGMLAACMTACIAGMMYGLL
jgi:CNT family concentrative nucleoside transporter